MPHTDATSKILSATCWIPAAVLLAVELYARRFEGWGAWATGPLFLLPLILSLVFALLGGVQLFAEFRAGSTRPATLVVIFIALLPVLWLLVRRLVV